jgi:aminomethyltransferase
LNAKDESLRRTPLTEWHRAHGGKMVPFAGYEMPVAAVRERVGLFDITHMGEIRVEGAGAESWLSGLVTNRIAGVAPGKVVYTAMCREDGGVLDDMLIYRLGEERWLVVCNAANHDKIVAWLGERRPAAGVTVTDVSHETALVAVQGPDSRELILRLGALAGRAAQVEALDFYTAFALGVDGAEWIVSRTGYTGEHGYELYVPNAAAPPLWEELLARGEGLGVLPVGLAARDTLRFELCYCLYGHELSEDTSPLEAGIGWAVKFKKGDFVGREALLAQKERGVPRRLIGLEVEGRTIARQGAAVASAGRPVGAVTSGTFSPTLKRSLALALVAAGAGTDDLEVEVRGKLFPCRAIPYPFLTARVKGDPRAERE